ncbi:uncharacterized protein LOC110719895 [Chenopodium quinoa]|uniref:uncharacterized protein LOC110719895 n=1 Tax=Chenopodium quinoa TaxID=63459 RepID=UPI000B7889DD|nr:uncharacterized protein LOC110719895 [Chenopodium quinoa]
MTWHSKWRENDHLLHHPVDGQAWKEFDSLYPKFADDPRNARLGLATDGFSLFNSMSIVHTIIKDLKDLWEFRLETYDASTNQRFDMHVSFMTTMSDFPGYVMLSGWSTKGYLACPECHYETDSEWLPCSGKNVYRENRKFLDPSHPWRHDKRNFDGKLKERSQPIPLNGIYIENMLSDFSNAFGKKQKKPRRDVDDPNPWRKIPIFFDELPYWKHCSNIHNLDVMHIEKNVFATLLDISWKTKDNLSGRRDLVELNLMLELQPIELEDGSEEFQRSRFWMSLEQKRKFWQVIKNAKLPQGYASNLSRCVQVGERKIAGHKSHDAHFIMNYLLPITVKTTLPQDVASPLIRLCAFFKGIWSKTIDPRDLGKLQYDVVETLCLLERTSPPAFFFYIMEHLPIHLVDQIKLGGPVSSRCMYGIERNLHEMKQDVRNKARPEGLMAKGYQAKTCVAFIARFLKR